MAARRRRSARRLPGVLFALLLDTICPARLYLSWPGRFREARRGGALGCSISPRKKKAEDERRVAKAGSRFNLHRP